MVTPPTPAPLAEPAELIVRNGRQQGSRRPLKMPITILGSAKGCDVRLNVESVRPVHCMIAVGADGPCLRAWGDDDTFVNGQPVVSTPIGDGDVLRVGPFEFEIRGMARRAMQAATLLDANPVEVKPPRHDDLHQQLGEARSLFRRERAVQEADMARQRHDLATACKEIERREAETRQERFRLHRLRKRFINRWKKHWSTQRVRVELELDRVNRDRDRLAAESADFNREASRFRARAEVDGRRIEYSWEELRAAERTERMERVRQRAALDRRQQEIADQEKSVRAEYQAIQTERMRVEHHSAQLRIEADGLESRVVNLRAVLLQLEARRGQSAQLPDASNLLALSASEGETHTLARAAGLEEVSAHDQLVGTLERLAEELADQRSSLHEQADRLALARTAWREEEAGIVAELAALAEEVRQREDRAIESEKVVAFELDHLDTESMALREKRERHEGRQARLDVRETEWEGSSGRANLELQQRRLQIDRREKAMAELCRRWSERRRREVLQLRTEHRRCEKLRMTWSEPRSDYERREKRLLDQQRELAAKALVVERARQELLETGDHPLLVEKRIERFDRHLRSAMAKAEGQLENRFQSLYAEQEQFKELFRQATERIERAIAVEREAADRLAEMERRESQVGERERAIAETNELWKSHRESYERECGELRDEVDRLASLFIESNEFEPKLRARRAA